MKECTTTNRLITRYFSGDINADEKQSMFSHLAECESCKLEYDFQEKLESLLAGRPLAIANTYITDKVMASIKHYKTYNYKPLFNNKLLFLLIPFFLMCFLSIQFLTNPDIVKSVGSGIGSYLQNIPLMNYNAGAKSIDFDALYKLLFCVPIATVFFIIRKNFGRI